MSDVCVQKTKKRNYSATDIYRKNPLDFTINESSKPKKSD